MIDVKGDRLIDRPLEEVFEYMADLDNLPEWLAGCRKAWSPDGDGRSVGARIFHEDEFMGRTFEARFNVIEWVPNEKMVFEAVSGPFRGTSVETLRAEGDATRVEIRVAGEPAGFLKAMRFVAGRAAQSQLDESLDNLQRALEEDVG